MSAPNVSTPDLIEGIKCLLRKEKRPDTTYGVAKYLGASHTTATNWEAGRTMDAPFAIRAALALKMDPDFVLACLAAERAEKLDQHEAAEAWHRIALRLATAASVCYLLLIPFLEMNNPAF